MTTLNLEKRIVTTNVNPERRSLTCVWSDGHQGTFSEEWLLERSFSEENRRKRTKVLRNEPELFGADYKIQRDNFQVFIPE